MTANNQSRILLAHNYSITPDILPALTRDEFYQVFSQGLEEYKDIKCELLAHPHWMVSIRFSSAQFSVKEVSEKCLEALIKFRNSQLAENQSLPDILFLAGKKSTPPVNDNPEGLQTGEWGTDVVETKSAETFLESINWHALTANKSPEEILKLERINS